MTVRTMVAGIQRQVLAGNLTPDDAADLAVKLTALLYNIAEEMREADMAYKVVLLQCMREEKAANRARLVAETSPEYLRTREAKDLHNFATETIRSLRQMLRTESDLVRAQR